MNEYTERELMGMALSYDPSERIKAANATNDPDILFMLRNDSHRDVVRAVASKGRIQDGNAIFCCQDPFTQLIYVEAAHMDSITPFLRSDYSEVITRVKELIEEHNSMVSAWTD